MGQRNRMDEAFAGSSSEAARARERMAAAQGGSREISPRSRRIVGWTIALLLIGFFVSGDASRCRYFDQPRTGGPPCAPR